MEQDKKITYRDNPLLKKPGIHLEFEPWQIEEIQKCTNDPIYFIKNYIKIVSLDHGIVNFNLWDYQERMVTAFHDKKFVICKLPRQAGKCVSYNTDIKIKNKKTGEIRSAKIGDFFNEIKDKV